VGKTTFGLLTALFLDPKALLIFPTRLLARQAEERLRELIGRLGLGKEVLLYEPRKKVRERFLRGEFDILCGTNMFLHRNFENLKSFKFRLIFVDDTDSFLKRSKNVDNLFRLLGFSDEDIRLALRDRRSEETLKPRGKRVVLFRNLLGFDVQKAITTLRNVVDVAQQVESFDEALERSLELVRRLGKGGLLFLSLSYGREKVQEAVEFYRSRGVKAVSYLEHSPEELYRILERGDFDVAVGISHITNPLVRGLDLPRPPQGGGFFSLYEKIPHPQGGKAGQVSRS